MDIFDVIKLAGGLAFFLFGMNLMSTGLETMVGGKLESILKSMTSNKFKSLCLGAIITIAIQSSSAMTVMLVGLVNSGIMQLAQTIGVIMGSNIGTTFTVWILSAAGIEGGNVFTNLLKPENFSPVVALIGAAMVMFAKSSKKKNVGSILVGFALLMTGMSFMSSSVSGLRDEPIFAEIMLMFNNPFFGVLVGAVITAIIQSSAASMGILQSLALTGNVSFGMALPIIMGQNIGTCITAVLSSIGANKSAKRVTVVHIYFNVIGTVLCLSLFYLADSIFKFEFTDSPISMFMIAVVHTIFNVFTTLVLLPFTKQLEKLAMLTIKDKKGEAKTAAPADEIILDERLLLSPSFAIAEARAATVKMAELTRTTIKEAINLMEHYSEEGAAAVEANEHIIDVYEDRLGTFLVKISAKTLTKEDSNEVSKLLHTIGDFERISDHAVNLLKVAREINYKKLVFSEKARHELRILTLAILDILDLTVDSFINHDDDMAYKVEPLEQVIDSLKAELKSRHIRRLQEGKCTIELGFVLSDILTNYERISDHCSNIAVCQIQIDHDTMVTHEYLEDVKTSGSPKYTGYYNDYKSRYILPMSVSSPTEEYQP